MRLTLVLMSPLLPPLLSILMMATAGAGGGDEASLISFKTGISGDVLVGWNGSTRFCSWEGVTCSRGRRTPRVVALNLPSLGLAGTLSPAIGNLTSLRELNLSLNWFHGEIPASISSLQRLRTLDLSDNSFSGELPSNLSFCTSMVLLDLSSNQLHGHVSAELGNTLTRLRVLSLENNSFTGHIPTSLSNLSSLYYLEISLNQFEGQIPPELSNIQDLKVLDLFQNNLSGVLPLSLYNLSSMKCFIVGMNKLYGSIPNDIDERFPSLQVFTLSFNQFDGPIPSAISNLPHLRVLCIDVNRFSGYVPPTLGRLRALTTLDLSYNKLEANNREGWEFIPSLANCSQLRYLALSSNSFRGQLPGAIVNLSATLHMLYLTDLRISGSIPSSIGNLVGLTKLQVVNTSLSGVIPESIGKLSNLVELHLYNNVLSGLIPSSVGNLTTLNMLFAYDNNLEGPIPASLGRLKNLFTLDLGDNYQLNGSIPKEIFELPSLSWYLDLSNNSLSGPLPSEVGNLANLNELKLSGNKLSGEIPDSIKNCEVLEYLLLDDNSFDGNIPESLKDLKGLRILNLTMNSLSGRIPDALGSIGNLQELYLACNNLSGAIPTILQNLTLFKLDVSFNNLQGEIPEAGVFQNLTGLSIAGNKNLCGGMAQLHLAPCPMPDMRKNRKGGSDSLIISLAPMGAILFLILVLALIWLMSEKLKQRQKGKSLPLAIEGFEQISYFALSRGTDGFSEANLLGKGSYGSVYKCTLHVENTITAVKVFNLQQSGSSRSFVSECAALRMVRHRCLIKIITCCSSINPQGQDFKALVFEFMPNGSLYDWLHLTSAKPAPSNTLSLAQRLDIAVDIMDALDYLHNHCQPPIIHCDLKPSNILLAEDMSARVGDFGISRILSENTSKTLLNSISSIGITGSIGYVAPEYGEGCFVSTLGDVYSLGILLLEMFTGKSPTDDIFGDSLDLHNFVEAALPDRAMKIADPTIWLHQEANDMRPTNTGLTRCRIHECLVSVFRLGISCSNQLPRERILMRDAAAEMHAIRDAFLIFAN